MGQQEELTAVLKVPRQPPWSSRGSQSQSPPSRLPAEGRGDTIVIMPLGSRAKEAAGATPAARRLWVSPPPGEANKKGRSRFTWACLGLSCKGSAGVVEQEHGQGGQTARAGYAVNRGNARTAMPSCFRARIYARGRGSICKVAKNAKLIAKLLEAVFSSFAKKRSMPS